MSPELDEGVAGRGWQFQAIRHSVRVWAASCSPSQEVTDGSV